MRNAANLGKHELIGLNVTVFRADAVELQGLVTNETMNTFEITSQSRNRTIPKTGRRFAFDLDGKEVSLEGENIRFRPEDRTKKVR